MPVDNTYDVAHEKNKTGAGYRAGCFNRPLRQSNGYAVLVRNYLADGTYHMVMEYIENRMTDKCRQILPLAECEGCTTPKDQYEIIDGAVVWK